MSIVMQINPFEYFADLNGDALDAGYIWIGEAYKDPKIYPVSAYYDSALTIPAQMPLRTSGGYIVRNGAPTYLYINGNYSIKVEDRNGRQIYYIPDFLLIGSGSAVSTGDLANATDPLKGAGMIARGWQVALTVAEAITLSKDAPSKHVYILGYYAPGDGGGGPYTIKTTGTANGGTVIAMNDGGFLHLCQVYPPTLRQFGCKGDWNGTSGTDDTAGFLAAVNTGLPFDIGNGRFLVSPIGPTVVYPGGSEPNRTSGAVLATGQTVRGLGDTKSELVWGSPTKQAFFGMRASTDIVISGIKFTGGYAPFIVDPTSDGSVQRVGLFMCTVDGCITGPIAGRQLALDNASKSCADIWMEKCTIKNVTVHGWIASNCDRPRVINNTFLNIAGGFCSDFSQGCRSPQFIDNRGNGMLHFFKFESSNVYNPGGEINADPTIAETRNGIATGNIALNIEQFGCLLNSGTNGHLIKNNRLQGSITNAIFLAAVSGYSNPGQCEIAGNIISMTSINATGIRSDFIHPTMGVIVEANSIQGGLIAIDWRAPRGIIRGNSGTVSSLGIQLGVASLGVDIDDNTINAPAGITATVAGAWRDLRIRRNRLNVSTGYAVFLATLTTTSNSELTDNTINNATVRTDPAIIIANPRGMRIKDNAINLIAGSGASIFTSGTTLKTIVSGNISTTANTITGPDASTTANNVNNITDATYVA